MRGLTLRIANKSSTVQTLADLPSQPPLSVRESRELLYTNEVQASLEYGSINALSLSGAISVQFTNGTTLALAAIGRTFTGATPTTVGDPGLVPTAQPANYAAYLKGDGTWTGITPLSIGAVPESKYTTQGDILFRGVTTSERLPLGTLGQSLRAGVVNPEWGTTTLSGLLAARPAPSAYYQGVFFWATDTSALSVCHYDGTSWIWSPVGSGGGGGVSGITRKILLSSEVVTVPTNCQYLVYDSITFLGSATMVLQGNADLVVLDNPVIIPGYTRKEIPSGENVIIPNGGQYLVDGSLTLLGTATLTLQGNADLVVLGDPPVPWTAVLPASTVVTTGVVPQTLATLGTTLNAANFYDITINAYRTDLSAQVGFKVLATVTNAAGVVTLRDVVITATDPGTVWTVSVAAAAPNVTVTVTGSVGVPNTVRWGLAGTALVN